LGRKRPLTASADWQVGARDRLRADNTHHAFEHVADPHGGCMTALIEGANAPYSGVAMAWGRFTLGTSAGVNVVMLVYAVFLVSYVEIKNTSPGCINAAVRCPVAKAPVSIEMRVF